jgi:hypothetical protein
MAEIKDSFTYSVAKTDFRGYLATGLHMKGSYFEKTIEPEDFAVLLSCGSGFYPISLDRLLDVSLSGTEPDDVFSPSGEYSNELSAGVYCGRKRCEICDFQTNRLYKTEHSAHRNLYPSIRDSETLVEVKYDELDIHEAIDFYHCHHCMKDIYEELIDYVEKSGRSVVLSNRI